MSVDAHLNILLIEDDRAIAKVIALELEHQGHQVKLAQDGRVGLDMALKNEWDVILLDIMLPFLGPQFLPPLSRLSHIQTNSCLCRRDMRLKGSIVF